MPVAVPVLLGVPVDPDAAEARRLAEEELAKAIYDHSPSLIDRLLTWLQQLYEALTRLGGQTPSGVVPLLLVLAFAAVVALGLLLGGRARRRRLARTAGASAGLFEDVRTSTDLTREADAAARRGDHSLAVLERFRAIIRSLDERALLDDRPGLTAHEATALATAALPDLSAELDRAGRLFDDVRYGHAVADAGDDQAMRHLAEQVGRTDARAVAPVAVP
ncbi:DUF4129 domain-containing protein [Georgenia yuyongxinii]|uniref:DUF4129 domain-containing protein n=1 Tax=Georgenia yuyongxinii TaxID=2589797 RepID=A0A552WN32_9MICO|nr:DUF4129 domain-containing protein [Georgenia yuyongxinii]TRW44137.1 DUF4129 domain-containing protein [Georgenia yuyongxinii]